MKKLRLIICILLTAALFGCGYGNDALRDEDSEDTTGDNITYSQNDLSGEWRQVMISAASDMDSYATAYINDGSLDYTINEKGMVQSDQSGWHGYMDKHRTVTAFAGDGALLGLMLKEGSYDDGDLSGTWYLTSLTTGADAPGFMRGSISVDSDQEFTIAGVDEDDNPLADTGELYLTGTRIGMVEDSDFTGYMDSGKTVISAVDVSDDEMSYDLYTLLKKGDSYTYYDWEGKWYAVAMQTGSNEYYRAGEAELFMDGAYCMYFDNGTAGNVCGNAVVNTTGLIEMDDDIRCFMDAGKTVISCVGEDPDSEDTTMYILVKSDYKDED
ncbi:hypothetical protein [Limisalsivibrio acetivorans]|uniref:hypothetical protein n=1 Tax=Limisalsivibrio acetivorans TaxID=1304888 RepID=UPI0003B4EE55|nr:hypothetical protein [Limisalsivibrio acetivorans]